MSAYTTQKLSRNRVAIFKNGEYLCQLQPKEVRGWIFQMERSDKIDAEAKIEERKYRIINAMEYLAKRALRPKEIQLNLF